MKTTERPCLEEVAATHWLVLGANGFIGRAALAELQARGRRVAGTVRPASLPADIENENRHAVDLGDVHHFRSLLRDLQPSVLLNAIGHPPLVAGPNLSNFYVRSTTTILEAVQAECPACRVVLLGSAAEYGNSPDGAGSSETDTPHPLSDYGRAKCAESEVARQFSTRGLAVITARLFNVIGPSQGSSRFVGALLERIRRGERPVRVSCGNHVRDWIDVRDVARALVILAESSQPPAAANICSGIGRTVEFVANAVGRLTGVPVEVQPGDASPDGLWRSVGNPARMFDLGWRPRYSLNESLADQWQHSL